MIVKNEEAGLVKCLNSAAPFVDEIIIAVDKASTDKTREIASRFADVLKSFDWNDDFAATRNMAQDGAKGDWILFLDGHEYIKQCEGLDEMLKSPEEGLMCRIQMENGMQFNNPRIFRRNCRFVGAVHEKIDAKTLKFFPKMVIQHDRAAGQTPEAARERQQQRNEQVPRIMGEQYRKNKKNTRATFHLGMHYVGRGEISKALMWFRRYLKYSKEKGTRWFVNFHMALAYLASKRFIRAGWAARRAEKETPGRWEIQKLLGLIYFHRGQYERAAEYLCNSFYQNTGNVDFKPWPHDDAGTWNTVGECFFRLKRYDKAALAFGRAAERATDKTFKALFTKRAALMNDLTKEQAGGRI